MSAEYNSAELPCLLDPEHTHYAYMRKRLGGKAVLETFELAGSDGEVAAMFRAIFHGLVDWDLHDSEGNKLPITQTNVDELHLEQFNKLRPFAVAAIKEGNKPLPNASGGRSPSTSSGSRSQRRSKKG